MAISSIDGYELACEIDEVVARALRYDVFLVAAKAKGPALLPGPTDLNEL